MDVDGENVEYGVILLLNEFTYLLFVGGLYYLFWVSSCCYCLYI